MKEEEKIGMKDVDQNIQWYQSKFESFEQSLNGAKKTSVHAMRRDAMQRFMELGFPTTRQEEWRFTNILPITKLQFQPILCLESHGVTKNDIESYTLEHAIRLVFIDGLFSPELSDVPPLASGIEIGSLAEKLKRHPETIQQYINTMVMGEENAFTALNAAFLWDGACIFIPRGVILEKPIHLLFVATNRDLVYTAQPRNLIIAGIDSQCKIVETYAGLAHNTYLTNTVTEISLDEHAIVEHDKVQDEGVNAFHMGTMHVQMNAASRFTSNVISLGGSIVRNNITARFDAEGAECILNGLSLARGTQVVDNHTVIDHATPHCASHELYKSILDGASKGVFNGKVFVRKDAQKTDAKQTNKTLLLSDDATMNTKPQLEIFADDVKCTHGATIGQLDDEQIFYLRSRGIGLDAARDILTSAFAGDVVNRITVESLRRHVERMIHDRLKKNHLLHEYI
jgi:Fe-S cluster assembly protein SufD